MFKEVEIADNTANVAELLARAKAPAEKAMKLHPFYRGKIETVLKCPVHTIDDFAVWYTPGVAEPCRAIAADPDKVYDYTNKWNTVAEIWPWEAKAAGATVVATGRSDFPNQVNNSLGFPGIFRGALDVRARTITDEMCFAAAGALADAAADQLTADHILPTMEDWEVFAREAAAVGIKAQEQGVARLQEIAYDTLLQHARNMIRRSRELTEMMMRQGFIPEFDLEGFHF
jgi:malic enzyme